MNTNYTFEVPTIDEVDFLDSLFKVGESYGDLFERVTKCKCDSCNFKEKCDKLYEFFEDKDVLIYCSDLINIMLGHKQIKDFM